MKAISLRPQWAHLVLCDLKTVEVRTWKTDHRGDLLICSSANPKIPDTISGHALCVASLDDVRPMKKSDLDAACMAEMPDGNAYAWKLSNIRVIKPFPVKGRLNLYDVDDSLIEYLDNGEMSEEEADRIFKEYYEPLLYKKQ